MTCDIEILAGDAVSGVGEITVMFTVTEEATAAAPDEAVRVIVPDVLFPGERLAHGDNAEALTVAVVLAVPEVALKDSHTGKPLKVKGVPPAADEVMERTAGVEDGM